MKTRQKRLSVVLSQQLREQNARQAKRTKLRSYATSGKIVTLDNMMDGITVFAPTGSLAVRFTCRANAAITPVFTCKTRSFGDIQVKVEAGTLFTNSVIEVPLSASNCDVDIYFQTSDSNGGFANWEFVK